MNSKNINLKFDYLTIGADIGGTNSKFGIFGIKDGKPILIKIFRHKSSGMKKISSAIKEVKRYAKNNYRAEIKKACIAVAGPVSPDGKSASMINAPICVDADEIKNETGIIKIKIINDFESLGFGINLINKKNLAEIKKGKSVLQAPIALIGAGTGLGKSVLYYEKHLKAYIPLSSEGGHADFPATNRMELELAEFIKKSRKIGRVTIEDVVSGRGLESIYYFLNEMERNKTKLQLIDESKSKPEAISKMRFKDKLCRKTFDMFSFFYARAAKNFALECLARGGVYIAGGIAPKNPEIFGAGFKKEFEENDKLGNILKGIPIYLVKDENAGLLGAGFASSIMQ